MVHGACADEQKQVFRPPKVFEKLCKESEVSEAVFLKGPPVAVARYWPLA